MDSLRGLGNIGIGSRLKRVSEYMMKETQLVYDDIGIDFDPYLFPTFKIISQKNGVTNSELKKSLRISQPAITQITNKLSKKGLINLKSDVIDKRKNIIELSKKGIALIPRLKPVWEAIEKTINKITQHQSNSLIEHLNNLEDQFSEKDFSIAILENMETTTVEIFEYENHYKQYFYDLNIEWLESFFYVEDYDKEVLGKPEKYIIEKGGFIFFAKYKDHIVGTVALMPISDKAFELTKMAVSPKFRGLKIGQKLMQKCLSFAKEQQLEKVILYSNKILENAIYIYRKYGFIEIPVEENSPYKRSDIKMEYIVR